jgi:hypothetical protein
MDRALRGLERHDLASTPASRPGARPTTINGVRGNDLLEWLAQLPAAARDDALERHLGIAEATPQSGSPGPDLIGYHASGVAAVVRALIEVPVHSEDTLIDLGAGLGKVVLLAHLLTGARAHGVELQPELVARSRSAAQRLGLDVELEQGDAREAALEAARYFTYTRHSRVRRCEKFSLGWSVSRSSTRL